MTDAIDRARAYSKQKIEALRGELKQIVPSGDVVVTCGSYARREASPASDIDFFVISQQQLAMDETADQPLHVWEKPARDAINKIVPIQPADDGAFSKVENRDSMLQNIGGEGDNNQKITRRMLFLLEGEWLHNEEGFKAVRHQILERYIGDGMTDHQLTLFCSTT